MAQYFSKAIMAKQIREHAVDTSELRPPESLGE